MVPTIVSLDLNPNLAVSLRRVMINIVNKKIISGIIIVFVVAVGYFVFFAKPNYKTYTNEKYNFTLELPENLVIATLNESQSSLPNFTFIDKKDLERIKTDPLFEGNPLIIVFRDNIGGLHLSINSSSWVASSTEEDIRSRLSMPAGGPQGEIEVILKDFTKVTTNDGRTIYLYTQEFQTESKVQDVGAIWINDGSMYTLENLSRKDLLFSKDILRTIAESFMEI